MAVTIEELLASYVYVQLADDEDKIRWTREELTDYVNFALHDLVSRRPDAGAVTDRAMPLQAGFRQRLPIGAIRLKEVVRNVDAYVGVLDAQYVAQQLVNALGITAVRGEAAVEQQLGQLVDAVATLVGEVLGIGDAQFGETSVLGIGVATERADVAFAIVETPTATTVRLRTLTNLFSVADERTFSAPAGKYVRANSVAISNDGNKIFVGASISGVLFEESSNVRCLSVFDAATGGAITDISANLPWVSGSDGDGVTEMAVSPNGQRIAVCRGRQKNSGGVPIQGAAPLAAVLDTDTYALVTAAGSGLQGCVENTTYGSVDYFAPQLVFSPDSSYVFVVGQGARRFQIDAAIYPANQTGTYIGGGNYPGNIQAFNAATGAVVSPGVNGLVTFLSGQELDLFAMYHVPNTNTFIGWGFPWTGSFWDVYNPKITGLTYTGLGKLTQVWSSTLGLRSFLGSEFTDFSYPGYYTELLSPRGLRKAVHMSPDGEYLVHHANPYGTSARVLSRFYGDWSSAPTRVASISNGFGGAPSSPPLLGSSVVVTVGEGAGGSIGTEPLYRGTLNTSHTGAVIVGYPVSYVPQTSSNFVPEENLLAVSPSAIPP